MAQKIDGYEQLLSRNGRGSLWLGEDHLLMVESSSFLLSYKETYRRLDFSNIQAIYHGPSRRGTWQAVVLTLLLLFFGWMMFLASSEPGVMLVMGLMVVLFLVLLIVHRSRGPSTALIVQTAVRPWRLPMVTRRRHADLVMSALLPLCQEAQKELSVTTESGAPQAMVSSGVSVNPVLPAASETADVPIHALALPAWVCLLLYGLLMAGELLWQVTAATVLMLGFGLAALVLLFICFGRGGGVRALGGRGVFTSAIVSFSISVIFGYLIAFMGAFRSPQLEDPMGYQNQQYILEELSSFPDGYPDALSIFIGLLAVFTMVTALMGVLASTQQAKRQIRETDSVDSPS